MPIIGQQAILDRVIGRVLGTIVGSGSSEAVPTYESTLAFHASWYDSTTKEMLAQVVGTGTPVITQTDQYADDYEGVSRQFTKYYSTAPDNIPVFEGGRTITQYLYDTDTMTDDGLGNRYLNMTRTAYVTAPDSTTTAITLTTTDAAGYFRMDSYVNPTDVGGTKLNSCWVRRRTGTGIVRMYDGTSFSTSVDITSLIDADPGEWVWIATPPTTITNERSNFGITMLTSGQAVDIWHPMSELVTGRSDTATPSDYIENTGTLKNRVTKTFVTTNGNSVTVDAGNPVVATAGTGILIDPLPMQVHTSDITQVYDSGNSSNNASAWYMEVESAAAQSVLDGFLSVVGTNWQLSDGTTTVTRPWTADTVHQVGIAYSPDDGLMAINVDDTWSADVAYDDTMLQGVLDLFRSATSDGAIRNLRRYSVTEA